MELRVEAWWGGEEGPLEEEQTALGGPSLKWRGDSETVMRIFLHHHARGLLLQPCRYGPELELNWQRSLVWERHGGRVKN